MRADVVIVGGGIAGSGLAVLLARAGVEVLVLEKQDRYRDRVRGEFMPPWGYAELAAAGLLDVVLRGDCTVATSSVPYDEVMPPAVAEQQGLDLASFLPGVPGGLHLGHPETCQALADEAVAAGACLLRGVSAVEVRAGTDPSVRFARGGNPEEVHPRLIVGADGRTSTVRAQAGIPLRRDADRTVGAGLLVEGLRWPEGSFSIGTYDDVNYFVFPRRDGRARLYLCWSRTEPGRFAGAGAVRRFLERFATLRCFPDPDVFRYVEPAGPCLGAPFGESRTDAPYAAGVVLVGDAGGYNDPIIGQGLSLAVRDIRVVAETLLRSSRWDAPVFESYAIERAERLRRLGIAAEVATALRTTFGPEGRDRRAAAYTMFDADPTTRLTLASTLVGPDRVPAGAFEPAAVERVLSP
jgi:2-polyprenyl-6-methoxyphenol hydroxylase-like FAD-dependent oxidoreductase